MTLIKVKASPAFQAEAVSHSHTRSSARCSKSGQAKPHGLKIVSAPPIASPAAARPQRRAKVNSVALLPYAEEQELKRLDRELLAPSVMSVCGRTLHALVPALVIVLCVSWVAAVASGSSPLSFLERGLNAAEATPSTADAEVDASYDDSQLAAAEAPILAAEEEVIEQDEKLGVEVARTAALPPEALRSTDLIDQDGQIKFISGLIAVHRPSIVDCGAVARDIVTLSAKEDLDPFYIAAVISIESRFGASERSHAGALGLMQLLPETALEVSTRRTGKKSHPVLTDSKTNIALGVHYIKELEQRYDGNRFYALAAYNWGPANVDRARAGQTRIPGSVTGYANTILERSVRWHKHFNQAKRSAMALNEPSVVPVAGQS